MSEEPVFKENKDKEQDSTTTSDASLLKDPTSAFQAKHFKWNLLTMTVIQVSIFFNYMLLLYLIPLFEQVY